MLRRVLLCVALVLAGIGVSAAPAQAAPDFAVLVFSKTAGFRHDSIAAGITAVQQLAAQNNFTVEATEDASQFTDANLARFKAVIWMSTTADVLDATQQAAFERYIRAGNGYVGVHAASDTEYDWAWYGNLVGAYFSSHPAIQPATVRIQDTVHPSTAGLPVSWSRTDEWYSYRTNPRSSVHVLATLDESTYSGGTMGADHPIAWCKPYDGGRSFYTGMGHTQESYSEANFRTHLLGGIRYAAAGVGDCSVTPTGPAGFNQVTLAKGAAETGEPMGLTVLNNRGVLHTSRDGTIRYTDVAGNTKVALTIPVYTHDEEGLQSIKADPNFATNRWVYVYYAPPLSTPAGDAPTSGTAAQMAPFNGVNRLARYTVLADFTLDPASAVTVLDVPTSRGQCCHVGGDMDFDAAGNLYLSTGDDTNPFESNGYAPIDERSGRNPAFDAQRTSANSNDLRGKVLRIKPSAAGGYTIPSGNMFAPGTANTRPEVYAMGFRNPFRMSVDKATGAVYLGDYGPDAGSADAQRGPAGTVSFDRITQPGFYGWPYCSNFNVPYNEYTFPTGPSTGTYNCAGGPTNNSPNNTGITQLPASQTTWLPYGYGQDRSELCCGSLSPMAGPVYRYDAALVSDVKFPASYNGKFFAGEFGRKWIKTVTPTSAGAVGAIESFPWTGTQIMDMEFGPDGALYVLDYGTGWFGGDANSAVYRIEYNSGGGRAPVPVVNATPIAGNAPLTVQFSSAGTSDPDGNPITYAWDFQTNGSTDSTAANPSFTYTANGEYTATLTVSDNTGRSATASVVIGVGRPSVQLVLPTNGRIFQFGDLIPFQITVTDPNSSTIDCSRVKINYILGHDTHGHPITSATGCSGSIQTTVDGEHDASANIFGVFDAEYTPVGSTTAVHATQSVAQPRTRQAEHYGAMQGIQLAAKPTAHGGNAVGYIENNDWISFQPYNLTGVTGFSARVASAGVGGTITLRTDSVTGPVAGTVTVAPTGGWETWVDVSGTVTPPTGAHQLFLVFTGGTGSLFDVDDFTFTSGGTNPQPGTNLALNKPATASSVQSAEFPASLAVDASLTTRWSSLAADPQWIQVDLGQSYAIDRVKLTWEAAYGSAYQVQTSPNGTTWTTVRSVTGGNGGEDDLTGLAANGRYVRINGTTRGTAWGYSLFGFEVYGGGTTPTPTNVALNKTATASSVEAAAYPASAAVDASLTTRWASAFSDPQWIQVDLGQSYSIARVKLTWEAAYGSAYQVQTSADGTTWTTVRSVTGGNGGEDDLTGLGGTGRYVRIYGTTRATAWGYSLFGFEVYPS